MLNELHYCEKGRFKVVLMVISFLLISFNFVLIYI